MGSESLVVNMNRIHDALSVTIKNRNFLSVNHSGRATEDNPAVRVRPAGDAFRVARHGLLLDKSRLQAESGFQSRPA